MDRQIGQSKVGELLPYLVIIVILLIICFFCFRMALITSKIKKKQKMQMKEDKIKNIKRFNGILHVGGLSAPESCSCSVVLNPEGLIITCGGNEFFLGLPKIKNVETQYDIDEKQYLKSSVLKGIAGAAAFGVSGAVIGSAPKTVIKSESKSYAIISYENNSGEYSTFLLRDENTNTQTCYKLVHALKPLVSTQINKVEL